MTPAAAQYMPHLDPNLYMLAAMNYGSGANPCLEGTALPEREIAEASGPALTVMQSYFRAAQGGGAKSAAFHLDRNTKWQRGSVTAGSSDLDGQADPLAAPGNTLDAGPLRFYRGGAGSTALGQWAVLDRQGEVAGVYTALFSRHRKVWKLRELTVFEAGDTVEPAAQYCRKPGDVMEHRLSSTEAWRSTAEERVATARTRLAEARAALAEARADATAESHDSRLVLEVNEARRDVAQWTKQVEQREKNLADAAEAFADARSDADENKRLTGAARNALAFRIADQETAAAN